MDIRLLNEIEHGKYLATHGAGEIWGWETPAGRLRWQRRVRMLIAGLRPGMRVLELGCGSGYFTQELARTGAGIVAIDISPELLAQAKVKVRADNVTFREENAYATTFDDASFDAVVGSSVLHHLEVERGLAELRRVLRPGALLHFTEPNMMNPQIAMQKNVASVKRRMGDSPDETAFFRWTLRRKLAAAGFDHVRIVPFDFLHPSVPAPLIPMVSTVGEMVERLPLVREISGSLHITARRRDA
jgi:2-polyprenyl-3-methyl-5-hydroxy-6-metoxy-1,4-benzoquinol methylase